MNKHGYDINVQAGTITGSIFGVIGNIGPGRMLDTALLAAIGATISFFLSLLFQAICKKVKNLYLSARKQKDLN